MQAWRPRAYHAGLKDAVRGKGPGGTGRPELVPVVVATIAFGMGIDRASASQCAAHSASHDLSHVLRSRPWPCALVCVLVVPLW